MEYLKTLISAAALYAVAVALAPEREGVRRACTIAFSLLLIVALLPQEGLSDLSLSFPLPDEETVGEEVYAERLKEMTEQSIEKELRDRFSVKDGSLSVDSDFSYADGRVSITCLTVSLSGAAVLADTPTLLRYVEENYGMKCEVIIGES